MNTRDLEKAILAQLADTLRERVVVVIPGVDERDIATAQRELAAEFERRADGADDGSDGK